MNSTGIDEDTAPPAPTAMPTTDGAATSMPPRVLTVKAFGITDKGKVRTTNEDQFLIAELTKAMRVWQTSLPEPKLQVGEERAHLFLVADGMGGHSAGERASALAVAAIEQFTLNSFKWFFGADDTEAKKVLAQFQSAFSQADARIAEEAAAHPELNGMGTTVTMAFHLGAQLCVMHVGDSRAYLFRDGELQQLTRDHSLVEELRRRGFSPDVYFDYDESTLSDDSRDKLARNADLLKSQPQFSLTIEGHADSRGTNEYNLALAERRAAAVRDYLVSLGIGAERVTVVSKGEEAPFCTEENETCWQQNRRGHFIFTAK